MEAVVTLNPDQYSATVLQVIAALSTHETVDGATVVNAIFREHPEYASGLAGRAELEQGERTRPPHEWASLSRSMLLAHDRLDGRLLVIGVALLEPAVARQLHQSKLLPSLWREALARAQALFARLDQLVPSTLPAGPVLAALERCAWLEERVFAIDSALLAMALSESVQELTFFGGPHPLGHVLTIRETYALPTTVEQWGALHGDEKPGPTPVTRELAVALTRAQSQGALTPGGLLTALFDPDVPAPERPLVQERFAAEGIDLHAAWERIHSIDAIHTAGYASDTVKDIRDRLGIERDVAALSALVAAERTKPPLSIGLFGAWGSGKSFFMDRMQRRVAALEGTPAFCRRIVQIEFNAWHYLDANLWASLVTYIFDELFKKVPPDEQQRIELGLQEVEGLYAAARQDVDRLAGEVLAAEAAAEAAVRERSVREASLSRVADDVVELLAGDPTTRESLTNSAGQLGLTGAVSSYQDLSQEMEKLQSVVGRFTARWNAVRQHPDRRIIVLLLVVVLVAPAVVGYVLYALSTRWGDLAQNLTTWFGTLGSLTALLKAWTTRANKVAGPALNQLEAAFERVDQVRAGSLSDAERQAQQALEDAKKREAAATENAERRKAQLARAQQDAANQTPGRSLQRFIRDRTASGDYAKHLSIVTLIRRDFEKLSELLKQATESKDLEAVDRIVLYIDDLDRCRAERVIEVLEAVHLLLAFRLFVVVVAVDPRWVSRCLELHYPELLGGRRVSGLDASSPQDYLEKIFQIPFVVRPINPEGYRELVRSLVTAPAHEPKAVTETARAPEPRVSGQPALSAAGRPASAGDAPAAPPAGQEGLTAAPAITPRIRKDEGKPELPLRIEPSQLEMTLRERDELESLAALFRTPRSVKRFINIYRLMRVALWPSEMAAFQGSNQIPGDYRTALLVLSLVTNYPRLAPHLFSCVRASTESRTWAQFAEVIVKGQLDTPPSFTEDDVHDWRDLCDRIGRLDRERLPESLKATIKWAPRVARYSFFVGQSGDM